MRNEPQTFVVLKQGPACSICAILLQPVSVSPFWRVLQAREVVCQQSHSETAFLQLLCAAWCLLTKWISHIQCWVKCWLIWYNLSHDFKPGLCSVYAFFYSGKDQGYFQASVQELKMSPPFPLSSMGWLFRNSPDIVRNIYCICFWSYTSISNFFFLFSLVS